MSTDTLDRTEELLVSTPETKTLFMARRRDLRLVKVPRYPIRAAATGAQTGETPGQAVQFADGVFRCPCEGDVELEGGVRVDAAEVHEWLEKHRSYGNLEEGFWRVDATAPAPSQDEIDLLTEAAISWDEPTIERLLDQERAGWNRATLVETAEKTLERIRVAKAAALEEAQAALTEAAASGGTPEPDGGGEA